MRKLPLILAGAAAFLLSLVVFAPARLLVSFLPASVTTGTMTGSIWNGATDYLAIDGRPLGAMQWHLKPLQLLRGRLALDVDLRSAEGTAHGFVSLGSGNSLAARDFQAQWPLASLPAGLAPGRWSGLLNLDLRDFAFDGTNVSRVLGTIDARNLQSPDSGPMGSYRLIFDEKSKQGDRHVGRLQDLDGPMQVTGTLSLGSQGDYLLEGRVAPRAGATENLIQGLRFLGEPDAQGRRPFSIAGTY